MRRIQTAACGVMVAGTMAAFVTLHSGLVTFAQQPAVELADPDIVFSENPGQAAADKALYGSVQADAVEIVEESSASLLREEYLDLLRQKSELMTTDEIAAAVDELKADITELAATRKLEAITAELQELIESHPETAAARRAEAMLTAKPAI